MIVGEKGKVSAKRFAAEFINSWFDSQKEVIFEGPGGEEITDREKGEILKQYDRYVARIQKLLRVEETE